MEGVYVRRGSGMKYVVRNYPKHILLFAILSVLLATITVSDALVLQFIINNVRNTNKIPYYVLVLSVIVFILIEGFVYYFQQFNSEYLAKKAINLYRGIVFKRITSQPISTFNAKSPSNYVSLMTAQMDNLDENYFAAIFWAFYLVIQFIVACVIALIINPAMAGIAIILCIPNLLLPLIFRKSLESSKIATIRQTDSYVAKISDYLFGFADWKINSGNKIINKQESMQNKQLLQSQRRELKAQNLSTAFNHAFSNVLYLGTWLIGAFFILNRQMTIASVVAFSQLVINISFPIYSCADMFSQIVGGKKLFEKIEKQILIKDNDSNGIGNLGTVKEIRFKDVSFESKQQMILNSLNLSILANKKYLIKGPSGSGKTTFLKILTKQILDYSGHITFNSQDFKNISDRELYSKIGYLPQHGHIFETTLANNLSLFQEKEREDLIKVLQFVELEKWANEEALNKQIDSESVSGGEAKRIELARILLQNKEIIILDEFSSELDKETFKKIENKIFSLPNKTVLYVTHVYDNGLINKADQVIQF